MDLELEVAPADNIRVEYVTQSDAPFEVAVEKVVESGMLQLSHFNITGVLWDVIGNGYELELLDGELGSDEISVTMSYANADVEGLPLPFILVYLNETISEPTWQEITTDTDESVETVTGISNLFTKFVITTSESFPNGGGGGGGLPRPGTGILLDSDASITGEEESDSRRGGGSSRSSSISPTSAGTDVETTLTTKSGTIVVKFQSVLEGGSQLKVNINQLSTLEGLFDISHLTQDDDDHGIVDIEGATYSTTGDVFDIDASNVKFEGEVEVTIPYRETSVTAFGSESFVRFIHFNKEMHSWEDITESVDEQANTVTGKLNALSPVVAAIILDQNETLADMAANKPVPSIDVALPTFSITGSGRITLTTDLRNEFADNQDYVMIVQVQDAEGIVQFIGLRDASLVGSERSPVSMAWNGMETGEYTVQLFLLTDLDNPWLLAEPLSASLKIQTV